MDNNSEAFAGFGLGLLLGCVILFAAVYLQDSNWKKLAVEKGHAEYVLQGDTAVWQWKEPVTK